MLVQAAPTVAETRFLLDVARASDGLVRGVVGWVDLAAPDAVATLRRLARDPLLKIDPPDAAGPSRSRMDPAGRRRARARRAPAARPALRRAGQAARNCRRCCGCWIATPISPSSSTMARSRDIAAGAWEPWASRIAASRELRVSRASCRGSRPKRGRTGPSTTLRRHVDHLLACFGPRSAVVGQRLAGCRAGRRLSALVRRHRHVACRTCRMPIAQRSSAATRGDSTGSTERSPFFLAWQSGEGLQRRVSSC